MPSTLGKIFKITTFGESHGHSIGVVLEGLPAGLIISIDEIQKDLNRRKPGQSKFVTSRQEKDQAKIIAGLFQNKTLGSPLVLVVENHDMITKDYSNLTQSYRPSHADYTYQMKYGFRSHSGGGRSSVRETIARVAAGSVARMILKKDFNIETTAWVDSIGNIDSNLTESEYPISRDEVDKNQLRSANEDLFIKMKAIVEQVQKEGDSIGGTVRSITRNLPPGLGDPVFDKLDGDLAKSILSIPACKGFEVGSGFSSCKMRGSEHNDLFDIDEDSNVITKTNHSGGLQGGISNGANLLIRAAFKPTSTISKTQTTINEKKEKIALEVKGRHDPCVLPRAVPIVESCIDIVLLDAYLYQRALHPQWFVKWHKKNDS